jgi:hypothetical protein
MSNDFYNYSEILLPGQVARAEDVAAELNGVTSGFNLLPKPRPDGTGFAEPFVVAQAVDDNQAATFGQLKTLETSAQDASDSAALSETTAAESRDQAVTAKNAAEGHETAAGVSAASALDSKNKALKWAEENEDIEVETGLYSARHWAAKAAQITSGARAYQGAFDASGGAYPIASPIATDEGKYWLISVAGTLPAGAVSAGDELAISASQTYEIIRLSALYAQKTNNLSDLASATTARSNLGLGSVAVEAVGTGANQVPKRDGSGNIPGNVTGRALTVTSATSTAQGSVRLATTAETITGTSAETAITPAALRALLPRGIILDWSGSAASVPAGWALCNGTNGTPDISDKFVIAAGSTYAVGATGGSADAVAVSHNHSASSGFGGTHDHTGSTNTTGSHAHGFDLGDNNDDHASLASASNGVNVGVDGATKSAGNHNHSLSIAPAGNHNHGITVDASGVSGTNRNLPPYYALAKIMRL